MTFLEDSAIWLVFSFLIFTFILVKMGKAAFINMLDGRIEEIKKEIDTAESLRIEAQELLAQYQRKHRDSVKEAEGIIANAESHAIEIRKNAEKELKETIKRREQQLKERLETLEAQAISEIQKHAADLAIHATAQIITEKMDKKTGTKLVDQGIKQVAENIH